MIIRTVRVQLGLRRLVEPGDGKKSKSAFEWDEWTGLWPLQHESIGSAEPQTRMRGDTADEVYGADDAAMGTVCG